MAEQVTKIIPSKGTRLNIMVVLEFLSIVWGVVVMTNYPELSPLEVFAAWADFTVWNIGIYASSETVVKGSEGYMNR